MSCNYADGLSPYENKGVLGVPEKFDSPEKLREKCLLLAQWLKNAKHVVVHTGAGISTSAGIPDFRGPKGVWTLEKQGEKPKIDISFNDAIPTKTHMALKYLLEQNYIHYIISQNIDGLHLRSGMPRSNLAELHGNMFVAQCNTCESQFVRQGATSTVGKRCLDESCLRSSLTRGRSCRGKLHDTILDWEHNLPENDLELSDYHSGLADLNICLGTTLQIVPSGNLPLRSKKFGGKLVIVNLQPTKHDKKADLIINYYVDDVMENIMQYVGLEIPKFSEDLDPTKNQSEGDIVMWDIIKTDIKKYKTLYEKLCKDYKKRKLEEKQNNSKSHKKLKESTVVINTHENLATSNKHFNNITASSEDKISNLIENNTKKMQEVINKTEENQVAVFTEKDDADIVMANEPTEPEISLAII